MHVCRYVSTYVCKYVHIYAHIYAHTYLVVHHDSDHISGVHVQCDQSSYDFPAQGSKFTSNQLCQFVQVLEREINNK